MAGPDRSRSIVVAKLGGSLLTRKREVEKLRPKVLARLAAEVAESEVPRLVLLHGAGSFGHPGARKFGLAEAPRPGASRAERRRGAAIVATEVRRLHLRVLRELVAAGTTPWSIPPALLARNRAGGLAEIDLAPLERALVSGLLPVSFGDVVPDDVWDFSILSADTLATEIARRLPIQRVVFATDVPGVYGDAARSRRSVVDELTDEVIARLPSRAGASDVTGGIRAKAEAMRTIAATGADAVLISGLSDGALSRAIRGETVYGSWAHARAP